MTDLKVKLLTTTAKLPTVGHPGEDLGYDLHADKEIIMVPGHVYTVSTGIAVQMGGYQDVPIDVYSGFDASKRASFMDRRYKPPMGFKIYDRSSMALKGIFTHGGVIDAGYRNEIKVIMSILHGAYRIKVGDKIAQMEPRNVLTGKIVQVEEFDGETSRGLDGFGSTGR